MFECANTAKTPEGLDPYFKKAEFGLNTWVSPSISIQSGWSMDPKHLRINLHPENSFSLLLDACVAGGGAPGGIPALPISAWDSGIAECFASGGAFRKWPDSMASSLVNPHLQHASSWESI